MELRNNKHILHISWVLTSAVLLQRGRATWKVQKDLECIPNDNRLEDSSMDKKSIISKHEDLSLDPQHLYKKPGTALQRTPVLCGNDRTEGA